jgi:sarcosine oxidase
VLAAGAWTNDHLAALGRSWPLTVTQEQVTYFATPHLRRFLPAVFPAWSWFSDQVLYGFPVFGEVAVKAAQDLGGLAVSASTRTFEPDRGKVDRSCTRRPASTPSRRTATSCSGRSPACPSGVSRIW